MGYSTGDVDLSEVLTDNDHFYPALFNESRQSNPATAVVGTTSNCQYSCDGTADDVQIQAAIDAVSAAGGGTVFIKAGTYTITSIITLPDNINFVGESWASKIVLGANLNHILYCINSDESRSDNVTIKNLNLDGDDVGGNKWGLIICSDNFRLENCLIQGARDTQGVNFSGANAWIKDNYFYHIHSDGGGGKAIVIDNGTNVVISGNIIKDCEGQGIWTAETAERLIITDNFIDNTATLGGGIWSSYDTDEVIIANNYIIVANTELAISVIHQGSENAIVRGNIVESARYGLEAYGQNIIIDGNIFETIVMKAIYLHQTGVTTPTENVIISNNIIKSAGDRAIDVSVDAGGDEITDVKVLGNIVKSAGSSGFFCGSSTKYLTIANNTFAGATGYGTQIRGSHHVINGNTVYNNANHGILLDGADLNSVFGNNCFDNQDPKTQIYGIYITEGSDYNNVIGNISRAADHLTGSIVNSGANNALNHNIT